MSDAWFRQKRPPLWISPRILRKYYADFLLPDTVQDKQQQIFRAVIDGIIRAKHNGRILTTEEAAALGKTRELLRAATGHPIIGRGRLTGFQARSNRIGMSDATTRRPGSWAVALSAGPRNNGRAARLGPAKIVT